jgi:hypothetical protein
MIFPRKKGADMVMTLDMARNPTAAGRQAYASFDTTVAKRRYCAHGQGSLPLCP